MMFSDARVAPPGLTLCPACTPPVNKILDPPLRLESQTRVFPLLVKSSQCIEKPEFTSPDTKITDLAFSGHLREKWTTTFEQKNEEKFKSKKETQKLVLKYVLVSFVKKAFLAFLKLILHPWSFDINFSSIISMISSSAVTHTFSRMVGFARNLSISRRALTSVQKSFISIL